MSKKNSKILPKSILFTGAAAVLILTVIFVFRLNTDSLTTNVIKPTPHKDSIQPTSQEIVVQPVVSTAIYPSGWLKYENKKYGYSFAYPNGMKVDGYNYNTFIQETNESSLFVIKGIDSIGGITVKKMSLGEAKQELIHQQGSSDIAKKVTLDEGINFNGYKAIKYSYETSNNGERVGSTHILIENNGKTYDLFWSNGKLIEIDFDNLGEKMFNTFRFD